jgi:hypothetical protein
MKFPYHIRSFEALCDKILFFDSLYSETMVIALMKTVKLKSSHCTSYKIRFQMANNIKMETKQSETIDIQFLSCLKEYFYSKA